MAFCSGIRADGGRCKAQAVADSQWCFNHHPDYEEARRQRASRGGKRGGRGRPASELAATKSQLQDMADKVLAGELERGAAAVAGQLLNIKLRALEIERKIKEADELEARIEALERERSKRWGA